jgi:integrase
MAKAKKLPSGNWRVQLFVGRDAAGKPKYRSFTAPTKREAEYAAANYALTHAEEKKDMIPTRITLEQAMRQYIDNRDNLLSPATIRGYNTLQGSAYDPIAQKPVVDITKEDVQYAINMYAAGHSPKSVRNAYGLLRTVLSVYAPNLQLETKDINLPQKEDIDLEIPEDNDIPSLYAYAKKDNADMYIAILLAATLGLRRSEICALTQSDFHDGVVSVTKALVPTADDKGWVIKGTKTTAGKRTLDVNPRVYEIIKAHGANPRTGRIITLDPDGITNRYRRYRRHLSIPGRFHDLRHYRASTMLVLGVPNKYAAKRMGHSTPQMTERVYQHVMKSKDKEYTQVIDEHIDSLLDAALV